MKDSFHSFFSIKAPLKREAGFTLIEMAVVATIIGIMSTAIIIAFARNRVDIDQSANLVMSAIRNAQTKAVASTIFNGFNPCGYGFHYVSPTSFAIYVGPDAATTTCSTINKNYQSNEDAILQIQNFIDGRVEFKSAFNDIYFQPPDPKTYLNNDATLNQAPIGILIGIVGTNCPTNCRTIYVYPSGEIETQ